MACHVWAVYLVAAFPLLVYQNVVGNHQVALVPDILVLVGQVAMGIVLLDTPLVSHASGAKTRPDEHLPVAAVLQVVPYRVVEWQL